MSRVPGALILAALLVLAGCSAGGGTSPNVGGAQAAGGGQVGLAAGGAKDVNNFRDNVAEGYLPLPSDMTTEGVFYDYYFDTGKESRCADLFCPSYSTAVTRDPLSNETERYVTVGLNSGINESDFERKKLNLVVVVDTSGSMESGFSQYYYDDNGTKVETDGTRKMTAAKSAVRSLTEQLNGDDRVGIVAYDGEARTVAEMKRVDERDMGRVRERIDGMRADGGTNLAAGMHAAESMVEPYAGGDASEYETRIVYVTDAMPNVGDTSEGGLEGALADDADRGIYSTFVGVGVDFNTELTESITDVRGANYYSVHSADQFDERMDEGFEYMVTPLVFDLELTVESEAYDVANVYGTPEENANEGTVMQTATLFASKSEGGRTKGGVILLQLDGRGAGDLTLTASYADREGTRHETTRAVHLGDRDPEYFENDGIRKAVLLSRYARLMDNWASYERATLAETDPATPAEGIETSDERDLGEWERRSTDLRVSDRYERRIRRFRAHFREEADALGDESLRQELDLMATILDAADGTNDASAARP